MPEGDTIFRTARALDRALTGETIVRFESVFPALTRVDEDHPIAGRTVESVRSQGKHLLIAFSGNLVLHTHMRMNGAWHVYAAGAPWHRPARDMRIAIETARVQAIGFRIPVAEFLRFDRLARHPQLARLGPDLLAPDFDAGEVIRRIREHPNSAIADVLLQQRVLAGIGNVFKSEVLFAAHVHPFARVADLDDATLVRIVDISRQQLRANVIERDRTLVVGSGRRTTGRMNPRERLWVYGRGGEACRRCGATIHSRKTGIDARLTFWCPACQTLGHPPAA